MRRSSRRVSKRRRTPARGCIEGGKWNRDGKRVGETKSEGWLKESKGRERERDDPARRERRVARSVRKIEAREFSAWKNGGGKREEKWGRDTVTPRKYKREQ